MAGAGAAGAPAKGGPPSVFSTAYMNGWTAKAFYMSWDGKHVVAERLKGFGMADDKGQLQEYDWPFHAFRNVMWAPDNKHFILWKNASPDKVKGGTAAGVAVLDADNLGNVCMEATHNLVYKKSPERDPFSAGWSPTGSEVYVASRLYTTTVNANGKPGRATAHGAVIEKVAAGGGPPIEIFRDPVRIDGFWMPWTRYEDGSGPNSRPFFVLVRASDGIYQVNPDGTGKEKISDLHQTDDIIWCPGPGNIIALLYNHRETLKDNTNYDGVYLCNLEKRTKGKPLPLEQLSPDDEVHTIWFSPKGKYFVWATAKDVWYCPPEKSSDRVKVSLPGAEGLEIKGCIWNGREDRLCVVAGNHVFVHDPSTKTSTEVGKVGEDGKAFGADPQWRGDDIIIGTYTNVGAPKKPGSK